MSVGTQVVIGVEGIDAVVHGGDIHHVVNALVRDGEVGQIAKPINWNTGSFLSSVRLPLYG
jgi:hypothetical protein